MLIIVRGLPGTGKTTFAKKIKTMLEEKGNAVSHFENDMFLIDENGRYFWDEEKITAAVEWCQANTALKLIEGHIVIVSNTYLRFWQLVKLLEIASNLKVPVEIYRCCTEYGSTKRIPKTAMTAMRSKIEDIVSEHKVYD